MMRKEVRKWHMNVLGTFRSMMHNTLLHEHNITSGLKCVTFEEFIGHKPARGYFAVKDDVDTGINKKYFIPQSKINDLPIRVPHTKEVTLQTTRNNMDVILLPENPVSFRIRPERFWDMDRFIIEDFLPFQENHTEPDHFVLNKIFAVAAYCTKTFLGICSKSEFGKSSAFTVVNSLTDKSPVLSQQLRTIPGLLHHINGDGNIVFDEIQSCGRSILNIIEGLTQQIASDQPFYNNGALKAQGLKSQYNVIEQSLTFLYNEIGYYDNPKNFFDYVFINNAAMDSRILKVKLKGKLKEKFNKDFDVNTEAKENWDYYIKLAKQLLWIKEELRNYKQKWEHNSVLEIKGTRRPQTYNNICKVIDMCSADQESYDKLVRIFDDSIIDYKLMVNSVKQENLNKQYGVEEI